MREQERSSDPCMVQAHPQGDTERGTERLKLATGLQDGCLKAPGIFSAAYICTLNLAVLSSLWYVHMY